MTERDKDKRIVAADSSHIWPIKTEMPFLFCLLKEPRRARQYRPLWRLAVERHLSAGIATTVLITLNPGS